MQGLIKRIYEIPAEKLSDNYYGEKIKSLFRAYKTEYDFCRFYEYTENGGGIILINNGNSVIGGNSPDETELTLFLGFEGVFSVEAPNLKNLRGFEKHKRYLLEKKAEKLCPCSDDKDFFHNERLSDAYKILESSFDGITHDLWYADTSHRIRHNVSELFLYKNIAVGQIEFTSEKFGFISEIAVMPMFRAEGFGKLILRKTEEHLNRRGLDARVFSFDKTVPFYVKNGYKIINADTYFTLKG